MKEFVDLFQVPSNSLGFYKKLSKGDRVLWHKNQRAKARQYERCARKKK